MTIQDGQCTYLSVRPGAQWTLHWETLIGFLEKIRIEQSKQHPRPGQAWTSHARATLALLFTVILLRCFLFSQILELERT